jgi:glycosyltransferase involved in cell wall biosynthesis
MISVIIPVKNEADKIERCLEAVFNQSHKPHEVIVVDEQSTDKTVESARQFPVKVVYDDYRTRAGACQIGVESEKGEFVAFTDADCIPEKSWLENIIEVFNERYIGVGGFEWV